MADKKTILDEPVIPSIAELLLEIQRLNKGIDTANRNFEYIQKSLDILNDDRTLLEENIKLLREVSTTLQFVRSKQNSDTKETQAMVTEVKEAVEDVPQGVEKTVEEGIGQILDTVKRKKNVAFRDPFWLRLKRKVEVKK